MATLLLRMVLALGVVSLAVSTGSQAMAQGQQPAVQTETLPFQGYLPPRFAGFTRITREAVMPNRMEYALLPGITLWNDVIRCAVHTKYVRDIIPTAEQPPLVAKQVEAYGPLMGAFYKAQTGAERAPVTRRLSQDSAKIIRWMLQNMSPNLRREDLARLETLCSEKVRRVRRGERLSDGQAERSRPNFPFATGRIAEDMLRGMFEAVGSAAKPIRARAKAAGIEAEEHYVTGRNGWLRGLLYIHLDGEPLSITPKLEKLCPSAEERADYCRKTPLPTDLILALPAGDGWGGQIVSMSMGNQNGEQVDILAGDTPWVWVERRDRELRFLCVAETVQSKQRLTELAARRPHERGMFENAFCP